MILSKDKISVEMIGENEKSFANGYLDNENGR